LLPNNIKIKIYLTIILPVVLYGLLTLRDEHRLRLFGNREMGRIFGPKRDEVIGEWGNYLMKSLMIYTPRPILFR
jgi:hypothetical protein